jgi:hypothetical protein
MITVAPEYRPAEVRRGFKLVMRCHERYDCRDRRHYHSLVLDMVQGAATYMEGAWTVVEPDGDPQGMAIRQFGPLCVFERVGDALRYLLHLDSDSLPILYASPHDVIDRLEYLQEHSHLTLFAAEYEPSAHQRVWLKGAETPLDQLPAGTRLAEAVRLSHPLPLTDEPVLAAALDEWHAAQPMAAR